MSKKKKQPSVAHAVASAARTVAHTPAATMASANTLHGSATVHRPNAIAACADGSDGDVATGGQFGALLSSPLVPEWRSVARGNTRRRLRDRPVANGDH